MQPWRSSRGAGASRWSTSTEIGTRGIATSEHQTRHTVAARRQTDDVSSSGFRQANLKPLRRNDMDLSSPSRGETIAGKSLTDPVVQEEFRDHLEGKVQRYQASYPDELGVVVAEHLHQKTQLDLILLEFRKLREGIVSSGRDDHFAAEAYETSAKLAIIANNVPQIATILPALVSDIHRPRRQPDMAALTAEMAHLQVTRTSGASYPDRRTRYISYYMLHLVCHIGDYKAYQDLLRKYVSFEDDTGNDGSDDRVPASHPLIIFASEVFRCYLANNYARMARIVKEPFEYDKFAWLIVRSDLARRQRHALSIIQKAYLSVADRAWLCEQLSLPHADNLAPLLQEMGIISDKVHPVQFRRTEVRSQ